ncbi:hypothetical protein ACEWPL_016620 [Roseovarius sp. S1116L3]|uniref:hypothetical protein n=1 Tax=Roseovarius roseus TaxID=3342636 RepID=UPI00372729DB
MNISSSRVDAFGVAAAPRIVVSGLSLRRMPQNVGDMLFSLMLALFAAASVYADEVPHDWLPEVIILPTDAKVQMERAIGSSVRLFSFSTAADVDALLADWSDALEGSGYDILPQETELDESVIEFSGHTIQNAKISAGTANASGQKVVTFDATLE